MRDYYSRLLRCVQQDLFKFWKEHVAVSLIVGIASAFVSRNLGTIDSSLMWRSALVSILCYGSILLFKALWAAVVAPVTFDRQKTKEVERLEAELAAARKKLETPISELAQSKRELVRQKLTTATSEEKAVLKHVLRHGEIDSVTLIVGGIPGESISEHIVNSCVTKLCVLGLLKQMPPQPGTTIPRLAVTPELIDAVSFYLLTQGPVAPPQG